MIWITRELALAVHDRQLAEHGGASGVRDESLLASALARPQQRHAYGNQSPDLADFTASLAFGLVRNLPFVDGNKRTAHVCYRVFVALNGGELVATDEEKYIAMLGLSEGSISESEFADWLRTRIAASGSGTVQEARRAYRR